LAGFSAFLALTVGTAGAQSNYKVLHDFGTGTDGTANVGGVVLDSGGNEYGVASAGGVNGKGMVWRRTPAGTYTDLHDFGAAGDGQTPWGGVIIDALGNLYGTCRLGGAHSNGTLWEIASGGGYSDLHDFGGTVIRTNLTSGADGYNPTGGVAMDSSGNLYGTADQGALHALGNVWKYSTGSGYKDIHDFGGTVTLSTGGSGTDGKNPQAGPTFDLSGNMYGTTYVGGGHNGGVVWEITSGGVYKDLYDFGVTGTDGMNSYAVVTVDLNGNLWGTTAYGGANANGTIWEIAGGTYSKVHDFGGTATRLLGGTGPDGSTTQSGVSFDKLGNRYGATTVGGLHNQGILWEITRTGAYVNLHDFGSTVTRSNGSSGPDGIGSYKGPTVIDSSGDMFGTTHLGSLNNEGNEWVLVNPISSVGMANSPVAGGTPVTGTVTLVNPAPTGGLTVSLLSNSALLSMPATVTVLAGHTTATFTVTPTAYSSNYSAYVFAYYISGSAFTSLSVTAPVLTGIALQTNSVVGGTSTTGTVTISTKAGPAGTVVSLSSNTGDISVPPSVTVAAGQTTSPPFTVSTSVPSTSVNGAVTAKLAAVEKTAALTITPPILVSVAMNSPSVTGAGSTGGTVTISSAAGTGGVTIALSSNTGYATFAGGNTVTVTSGNTTATFTVNNTDPRTTITATISAKLASVTKTTTLMIHH